MISRLLIDLLPLPFLIWMAATDWRQRKIPNRPVLCLAGLALILTPVHPVPAWLRILGAAFPALPLFVIAIRTKQLKGGDIKYLAALGAYVGVYRMAVVLAAGTAIALAWACGKKVGRIPLAFFLGIGYALDLVFFWI